MTLHSETDMARGPGAAIELDVQPSLLSVPRMQKSLVRFSKPELLSFDELVKLEQNESPVAPLAVVPY
jgi:hypothetical protein